MYILFLNREGNIIRCQFSPKIIYSFNLIPVKPQKDFWGEKLKK